MAQTATARVPAARATARVERTASVMKASYAVVETVSLQRNVAARAMDSTSR